MSFKNERFLVEAVEQCQLKKIISCQKHGHNLHLLNDHGQNLLVHLLKQQHKHRQLNLEKKRFQIFQYLIVHAHLSVDRFDHSEKNLFNWACNLNCTTEALYLLRSYPGDIDILHRDYSGSCSLHYAIEHNNENLVHSIVNYLLHYRLRFDVKDAYHNTPEDLARRIGNEYLAEYLADSCRSTNFLSREIPSREQNQRPSSTKSKLTNVTRGTWTSSVSSLPSLVNNNSTEFYDSIEMKINRAKQIDDWRLVAKLREYQRDPQGFEKLNEICKSFYRSFSSPSLPSLLVSPTFPQYASPSPIHSSALPKLALQRVSMQDAQTLLKKLEPQLSSSYRRAFIPHYERPTIPHIGLISTNMTSRKFSQSSSRRMSTILAGSLRRRESNASQLGEQNRLLLPPINKQQRSSVVSPRTSETGETLSKFRAKATVTTQN